MVVNTHKWSSLPTALRETPEIPLNLPLFKPGASSLRKGEVTVSPFGKGGFKGDFDVIIFEFRGRLLSSVRRPAKPFPGNKVFLAVVCVILTPNEVKGKNLGVEVGDVIPAQAGIHVIW